VRPDGGRQWAFAGKPLYTFAGDTYPGARLGAGGLWALMFETAELPAGFGVQSTLLGRVLADYKGRTLYIRVSRAPQTDDADWQPLAAPWLAAADGDWSFAPLPDGTRQWVYKGHPLFRYARDRDPQDVRGHGRASGAWTAVVLEPPPALPAWVTVQRVDLGWVFANRDGLTLYAPANFQRIKDAQTCNHACMEQYWRPVLAGPEDTPIGRWTITVNEAGQRQWTFAGRPLFLHTRDTKPGEMTGNSFAVGYAIGDGFRVIPIELNLPPAS
jgi:predicted lipoprotein with Yx(FWY)xxD motif